MSAARAFRGVIPAMAVPFLDDYKVDEDNLARFAVWLAGCRGVTAVMTNGHTGEVGSLLPDERATVTRVVADAVQGAVRVVSAVCAEGTFEAVEHARAAAHAGADTVDVMPCHMWLRFGVKEDAVYEYVKTIGGESGLDVIVHVYPASTRAAYSTRLMVRLASIPQVKGFKMGERDLGAYERDIRALRADAPHVSLLNCMDEYLFATFVHPGRHARRLRQPGPRADQRPLRGDGRRRPDARPGDQRPHLADQGGGLRRGRALRRRPRADEGGHGAARDLPQRARAAAGAAAVVRGARGDAGRPRRQPRARRRPGLSARAT